MNIYAALCFLQIYYAILKYGCMKIGVGRNICIQKCTCRKTQPRTKKKKKQQQQ